MRLNHTFPCFCSENAAWLFPGDFFLTTSLMIMVLPTTILNLLTAFTGTGIIAANLYFVFFQDFGRHVLLKYFFQEPV